jgi:GNAT superfamily N-acetyltransferase
MTDTKEKFSVRTATADDIDLVVNFRKLLFAEMGIGEESFIDGSWEEIRSVYLRELHNDRIRHFIASTRDNVPISIAGTLLKSDFPYYLFKPGFYGWIIDVYTIPAYRGNGLADRLMQYNHQWIKEKGGLESKLIASGADARKLYEREGYKPTCELSLSLTDTKTYNNLIDARGSQNV